ncbi:MAC/perforin domain-containing protein [Sphingobacterium deserti]|uniref:Membrane attack complex component/perforin/complement C9 n=1 Tax=Sphingobacterium deserti TaxID=1229276 RepID=A0A0B8T6T8_9SPHI|nr:MAC/perforin domain-containing protein [Sphingobacterium deserti]KGE13909.1 membrane attack complex component/perforin/complement C9 [Sphingobacterium deserti]
MKRPLFLLAIVALFASCNKEQLKLEEKDVAVTKNLAMTSVRARSAGMGPYDVLGNGYDVTGRYADAHSAGFKIIDVGRLKQDFADRVVEERPLAQSYVEEFGEDAEQYSKSVSNKVSATASYKLFGASLTTSFNYQNDQSSSFDAKYIYGSYKLMVKQKRYRINADANILRNYLTPEFLSDLANYSSQQLINAYGTHVMVDIYTGGRLDLMYQSQTKNQNRTEAARVGIKVGASFGFDVSVETANSVDVRSSHQNFSRKLVYNTFGGDPTRQLRGELNLDLSVPKISITAWQNSVTPENAVLVDFGYNGLIPIYDLIADPSKRSVVMAAVNQYISSGQTNNYYSKSPVYSLYFDGNRLLRDPKKDNHVLSMYPGDEDQSYLNEGIAFYAFRYKKPGTIPVYRYRNDLINNNFFTKDLGTYTNYRYEGIVFYVYPTANATTEFKLQPIYRHWSDYHMNHYFTAKAGNFNRYRFERIEFYVPQ